MKALRLNLNGNKLLTLGSSKYYWLLISFNKLIYFIHKVSSFFGGIFFSFITSHRKFLGGAPPPTYKEKIWGGAHLHTPMVDPPLATFFYLSYKADIIVTLCINLNLVVLVKKDLTVDKPLY